MQKTKVEPAHQHGETPLSLQSKYEIITNKEDEVNTRSSSSIPAFRVWTVSIGLSAKESGEGEDEEGNKGDVGGELRLLAVGCSRTTKSDNIVLMFRDPGEELGLPRPGEVRLGTHSDSAVWIMNKELGCHCT